MENKIYAIDVEQLKDAGTFEQYYERQRPERQARIDRIKNERSRLLCLGAGIVSEAALAYAGCSDEDIVITPEGKPTVQSCFFNISHTGDIAICAVSDREVGIDIERPRSFTEALIRRAFTPIEIEYVEKNNCEKNKIYTHLWTIKESVMKWQGSGLGLDPQKIDVFDLDLHLTEFDHEDYHITVYSEYEHFTDRISWMSIR